MAVAANDDLDLEPATADRAGDMTDHRQNLGPVRHLAGPQDHGDWLAAASIINVDGQEAAMVMMGMEQRELLVAVNPIQGVVDIEHQAPRHDREAVAEQLDHDIHHTREGDPAG